MRALQALSKVEQRWLRSLLHSRSYITAVLIAIGQLTKRVVGDEWGAKGQETLESDAYTRYRHRLRRFLIDSRARGGSIQGLHSPSRRIAEQDVDLKFVMESPIPDTWITGSGAVFYLSGWCFHLRSRITQIDFAVNDVIYAMKAQGMPRVDVSATFSKEDLRGYSLHSGFWTIVSVPGAQQATEARLALRVTLENGQVIHQHIKTVKIGLAVQDDVEKLDDALSETEELPLVAICMTTYNPSLELFAKQIQSIRDQTFSNWVCIISDDCSRPDIAEKIRTMARSDERFVVYHNPVNVGFYRNFERCLSLVPDRAQFIALSDQDDFWHADKIETLWSSMDDDTTLIYSDMNVIDEKGNLILNTFWSHRPNNYTDFESLVLANCVTGAASMFRSSLLGYVLPFPEKVGSLFHDHWLACVALAVGKIQYVDQSLYDYVQHSGNIRGYVDMSKEKFWVFLREFRVVRRAKKMATSAREIHEREWARAVFMAWRRVYAYEVLRVELLAQALLVRCDQTLTSESKRMLRRIGHVDESLWGLLWMALRGLKRAGRASTTVGVEWEFLKGLLWRRWACEREQYVQLLHEVLADTIHVQPGPESWQVEHVRQKVAPLWLRGSNDFPRRINLLIPTIDLSYFFGTYITVFNLALRLAEDGWKVRVITVDPCDPLTPEWKERVREFQGLREFFDRVELIHAFGQTAPIDVNLDDTFIATTWWTAHVAHRAMTDMGKSEFLYMIQEYDPCVYPTGTWSALARQTYTFPHYGLFSTEILRDYFRQNAIGVFGKGREAGERDSMSFENPITDVGTITVLDLETRSTRRLLFYARPEDHAARNMFEIGVLALSRAIEEGHFDARWEFYGIGKIESATSITLARGHQLHLLPRQSQDTYKELLRAHDLGLGLMDTPHPSLVPLEMASAGMVVVTNTFETKTEAALRDISSNIIAVEPTIETIARGLADAARRIDDYVGRAHGSHVKWSRSSDCSFDGAFLTRLRAFTEGTP